MYQYGGCMYQYGGWGLRQHANQQLSRVAPASHCNLPLAIRASWLPSHPANILATNQRIITLLLLHAKGWFGGVGLGAWSFSQPCVRTCAWSFSQPCVRTCAWSFSQPCVRTCAWSRSHACAPVRGHSRSHVCAPVRGHSRSHACALVHGHSRSHACAHSN